MGQGAFPIGAELCFPHPVCLTKQAKIDSSDRDGGERLSRTHQRQQCRDSWTAQNVRRAITQPAREE
jgi:hypothetical protein